MTAGLETEIVDEAAYGRNVDRLHQLGVVLPRIAELADPVGALSARQDQLSGADPDAADPRNLFRVHWHNGRDRRVLADRPDKSGRGGRGHAGGRAVD